MTTKFRLELERVLVEHANEDAERARERARQIAALFEHYVGPSSKYVTQDNCAPLSRDRFLRLCRDGVLEHMSEGKLRIVLRVDLERYLETRARRSSSSPRVSEESSAREADAETIARELGIGPARRRA